MSPTERTIRALQALEREVRALLSSGELAQMRGDYRLTRAASMQRIRFETLLAEIDAARAAVRAERRRGLV